MNMSRVFKLGRRLESCCFRPVREVEASTGRDKVVGRPRPGKDVIKTLIIWGAITQCVSGAFRSCRRRVDLCVQGKIVEAEMICISANILAATSDIKRLGLLRLINPHNSALPLITQTTTKQHRSKRFPEVRQELAIM